ncbi:MAG: uracil-DNA glycosylase [Sorangiineae bacterium]|nr:uracil-DNA glycosylase [Polyangiaceae bacterium]MEB2323360.1 uracil-DNA glycosylase [Sorangiineae bacterium]
MNREPDDPEAELGSLVSALLAHVERLAATGATGLERATEALTLARGGNLTFEAPAPREREVGPARNPPARPAPDAVRPPPVRTERALGPLARSPASGDPTEGALEARAESSLASDTTASAARARVTPGESRQALAELEREVASCTRCALSETRTQTVFARGTGASGLCFVGEGPGAEEDREGMPFVGPAGQLLDRMIAAMGLGRDEVYVCNIVKCRPPNNRKPLPDEMAACRPHLERQLEYLAPTVIVALGATAVQGLLGTTEGITRLRGKWKLYKGRIAVMPTFHPAYLLRVPAAKREVWEDLQAVLRQLGRPLPNKS